MGRPLLNGAVEEFNDILLTRKYLIFSNAPSDASLFQQLSVLQMFDHARRHIPRDGPYRAPRSHQYRVSKHSAPVGIGGKIAQRLDWIAYDGMLQVHSCLNGSPYASTSIAEKHHVADFLQTLFRFTVGHLQARCLLFHGRYVLTPCPFMCV